MKKVCLIILCAILFNYSNAQEENEKGKKVINPLSKNYIGFNTAPIFVGLLNGENFDAEWKIAYKRNVGVNPHFLRISYSYINQNQRRYYYTDELNHLYYTNSSLIPRNINDSTVVYEGFYKNNNNLHAIKIGYEYQVKLGKKKSISLNFGGDVILGAKGGKTFYRNDTIIHSNSIEETQFIHSDFKVVDGFDFAIGGSPFVAVGFPIRKRFDITFEMMFDMVHYKSNVPVTDNQSIRINSFDVYYRPSLMLNYRFGQ
ncbi:MAG: hypothetical protein ACPG4Z_02850 [Chitinophagales bacterium]